LHDSNSNSQQKIGWLPEKGGGKKQAGNVLKTIIPEPLFVKSDLRRSANLLRYQLLIVISGTVFPCGHYLL